MPFKIGDRVISHWVGDRSQGLSGTVRRIHDTSIGVQLDGNFPGHDFQEGMRQGEGRGWWIRAHALESLEPVSMSPLFTLEEIHAHS